MSTNLHEELAYLRQHIARLPPGSERVHLEGLLRRCEESCYDVKNSQDWQLHVQTARWLKLWRCENNAPPAVTEFVFQVDNLEDSAIYSGADVRRLLESINSELKSDTSE